MSFLAEKGAERLNHQRQVGVRAVDDLAVFALGLLVPMPGVLKRLDLRLAVLSLGRFEEEIVVALGIERRGEVNEVNGFGREVVAEDVEIVAVVKRVHAFAAVCGKARGLATRTGVPVSIFWTLFPIVGHAHARFRPKRDKMAHIVDKITHIAGILAHRAAGTARAVHRMGH